MWILVGIEVTNRLYEEKLPLIFLKMNQFNEIAEYHIENKLNINNCFSFIIENNTLNNVNRLYK
jgi:hypothetical protein